MIWILGAVYATVATLMLAWSYNKLGWFHRNDITILPFDFDLGDPWDFPR